MNRLRTLFIFIIFLLSLHVACSRMTTSTTMNNKATVNEQQIPLDSDVMHGTFANGLQYFIKNNHKPENRAQLWLVVNAGSVLEDSSQQGLAHFCEHMAFNGTKHFEKQHLVDYLESIGMKFGPEINAYTSFDETVYMLQVPTDSADIMEKGFQILEDWAHAVSYDDDEIDKERGVIIEEWRLGRDADSRMFDKQLPVLFKDSRYAIRLPIGKKNILESFVHDTLRQFYHDWYRPDLMAVIAVGDFDNNRIFSLIEQHFANIPDPAHEKPRIVYQVPDHQETLFAITTDPEATHNTVSIYFKSDVQSLQSVTDYRRMLISRLFNHMLNDRLEELTKQTDPPFLYGYSGQGRFVRTKEVYLLGAVVKDNGIDRGLDALLTEAERVRLHGFTKSELTRAKTALLRSMEKAFEERNKTPSQSYAKELSNYFLEDEPAPGIAWEYEESQQLFPGITVQEVNALVNKWITAHNRVVLVDAPEKPDLHVPTEDELNNVINTVASKNIEPYVDSISDAPLVANPPTPAAVVDERTIESIGVTEWILANGIKVVLKPTNFKNDEILFTAFSPGGTSLAADSNYVSAAIASSIVVEGGLGDFSQIQLQKKLTGKVVKVNPFIDDLSEGISGSASPQDVETMFQLIYEFFTSPREDDDAFASYMERIKGFIENRSVDPETAFRDTIQVTMAQHNFRERPWSLNLLKEINYKSALKIFRNRFADASDFTFIFVGNFQPADLKPLIELYLGGLPALQRDEHWRDPHINPPTGIVKKNVKKGVEAKSQVRLSFTGPFEWNEENQYAFESMKQALRIKLRQSLREDKGGTYGVGVWGSPSRYPASTYALNITWGCNPTRVDELIGTLFTQIDSLQHDPLDDLTLTKLRETQIRSQETNLKENKFWLTGLQRSYWLDSDPELILDLPKLAETLSKPMIQRAAQHYLNTSNYVQVVLYPADYEAMK
ncbi:insulinase family protein [candidate division KSB1 bacterium]|nr:insulinase family protein [candidate division KSB1 bacterium]